MKKSEAFPSKYLKAEDLRGKPVVVTITKTTFELLKSPDGKEQHKTVLHFNGAKKTLPLNLTNWDSCAAICGDDSDDWPGNKIEIYPAKTQMGGKMVDCVRIRPPAQRELLRQNTAAAALNGDGGGNGDDSDDDEGVAFDDAVPF